MADLDLAPSFGSELKDGFKPVNAWVAGGIAWLDDIQQFYRERSVIEKEYSAKLNALAKKYFEKKAKRSSSLSVGDTPTLTPGSLESASLTTWTTQLSTLESRAAEHDRHAAELQTQVADPLRNIAARYEELRKSHAEYAGKLERERETSYSELRKQKGRYDGACQEVENRRKKTETSFDSSKGKAQNAYQQQLSEMHNVKNTYIISINVTNKLKERYYNEYVPDLLDDLQDLSETRVAQVNSLWQHAVKLETSSLSRSIDHLKSLSGEIPRNEPRLDSTMFIKHNSSSWQDPPDFVFEPSPVWLDDSAMAVDDTAKIFLRNVLSRSKGQSREVKQEVEKKRRDLDNMRRLRQKVKEGREKHDEADVVRSIFTLQEDLHLSERRRLTVEVETSTIMSAVGDVSLGAQNHNFKPQTFKIPTNCDLCGERIWGLSAKGFDCRDCGFTCHSKCEMKVPADCPGEQSKEERKKLKAERQASATTAHPTHSNGAPTDGASELSAPGLSRSNTLNSLSSGYAASAARSVSGMSAKPPPEDAAPERTAPAPNTASKPLVAGKRRVLAPPPTSYVSELPSNDAPAERIARPTSSFKPPEPRGKMLYTYEANSEGEISIEEGQEFVITEEDDGSGWTTIRTSSGTTGLVPTTYFEPLPPPSPVRPISAYSGSSAAASNISLASSTGVPGSAGSIGKKVGPAVAPKRGGKKLKYVEALYDYEARSDQECSMVEGERFVVVRRDAGDGWAEVEKGGVVRSVPANYVRDA